MKTEESSARDDRQLHEPGAASNGASARERHGGRADGSTARGGGRRARLERSTHGGRPAADEAVARSSGTLYWARLVRASSPSCSRASLVWALTPPSGAEVTAERSAGCSRVVRAQPVPVGIVLFTLFEIALWAARHQLPARGARAPAAPRRPAAAPARPVRARARAPRRGRDDPRPAREGGRARAHGQGARAPARPSSTTLRDVDGPRRPSTRTRSSRRSRAPTARSTCASGAGARARCASTSRRS